MGGLNRKQILLLIFSLILTFIFTYQRHVNYPFPYHHDEWQHLGISRQIMQEGYNKQYNPFIGIPSDHADLEPGFHFFLSVLFSLTNLDPVLNFKYLASIFAVLAAFAVFICCYYLSKEFNIALISILIFMSLKTNVNLLGKEFFVPLSVGLFFIFSFSYIFLKSLAEKKQDYLLFSVFISLILFLTHLPSLVILLIPVLIELITHFEFIKSNSLLKRYLIFMVILPIFLFLLVWKGNLEQTKVYLFDLLVFEKGWGKLEITFFIPLLYGLINTFLALFGYLKNNFKARFFVVLSFISIGVTAFFNIFGFSLLVPYPRAVHYAMVSLILFSSYGFYEIIKRQKEINQLLSMFVLLILIMNIPSFKFLNYKKDIEYKNYNEMPIYKADYDALIWLNSNYGNNNVVVAPYFMSSTIYTVSGNRAISLIPAVQRGGLITENLDFWNYGCSQKKELMKSSNASFLLSRTAELCDGFKPIYTKDTFIYNLI